MTPASAAAASPIAARSAASIAASPASSVRQSIVATGARPCFARCAARSASSIGVTGWRLIVGCRSMRNTGPPTPACAKSCPNTHQRPRLGCPPTSGTHGAYAGDHSVRTASPTLPTPGALSQVEQTL
jgi:hypothetical protein